MTGAAVALAGGLVAAALVAVCVVTQRGLAQVAAQIDHLDRRHPPNIQQDLDQFWAALHDTEEQRATAVDERLQRIEAALAQAGKTQDGVIRLVNWMAPLVRHWSNHGDQR